MKAYAGKRISKRISKRNQKYLILCLLGLFLLGLGITGTGCSRVEPELRAYPLAMGFDWADGKYNVYYAMPDLSTFTGEGKTADTTELLWVYEGSDYGEIEQVMHQTKQQKLDLGHVQVILFGKGLLENPEAYDATMNYLLDQPVLGSGSYVFRCPKLAAVMGENGNMTDSLGEYLTDLIKKEKSQPAVVQDLYNAWYNKETLPQLMTVRIRDGQMEVEGLT